MFTVFKTVAEGTSADPNRRKAFIHEADAWIRAGSSSFGLVLPLEGIAEIEGELFLQMPYCLGGSLRDRLHSGPLPPWDAFRYLTQVLLGLWELERMGLVHRDLKPENVLINGSGTAVLTDLGIARILSSQDGQLFKEGASSPDLTGISGTLPYMAPEQLLGHKDTDSGVDLWAFGVLAIELLTGRRPFGGDEDRSLIRAILTARPSGVDHIARDMSRPLGDVLSKLLAKNRRHRYATLRDALIAWDKVIKLRGSPRHSRFWSRDARISVPDPSVENLWIHVLFPERGQAAMQADGHELISWSIAAAARLSEAEKYYKLDQFKQAIDAARAVLGRVEEPTSNFARLLVGSLPEKAGLQAVAGRKSRMEIVLGRPEVAQGLQVLMWSYVGLIETGNAGVDTVSEALAIADVVRIAPASDIQMRRNIAQIYILTGQAALAQQLMQEAINTNPDSADLWNLLWRACMASGERTAAYETAKAATLHFLPSGECRAMRLCAEMCGGIAEWPMAARCAELALAMNPVEEDCLYIAAVARWNNGEPDAAKGHLRRLASVAPAYPKLPYLSGLIH